MASHSRTSHSKTSDLHALVDLGIAAAQHGRHERARRYLEAALDLDPAHEDALLWLAALTDDREDAAALVRRCLAEHPESRSAQAALRWFDQPSADIAALPEGGEPRRFRPPWEAFRSRHPADRPSATEPEDAEPLPLPDVAAGEERKTPPPAANGTAGPAPPEEATPGDAAPHEVEPSPAEELVSLLRARRAAEAPGRAAAAEPAGAPTPIRSRALPHGPLTGESVSPAVRPVASPSPGPEREPDGAAAGRSALAKTVPGLGVPWRDLHRPRNLLMLAMLGFVLFGVLALALLALTGCGPSEAQAAVIMLPPLATATTTPSPTLLATGQAPSATASPSPSATPTRTATASTTPTATPTVTPSPTPGWVTGVLDPLPLEEKWIEVDLGAQTLRAYEGGEMVFETLISSGRANTPTIPGRFRIQTKWLSQTMQGSGYLLPDVPHVMYYSGAYALHGAYWHDAWGTPMSRGCVNLAEEDARWLFGWADPPLPEGAKSVRASAQNPGTWVLVHE